VAVSPSLWWNEGSLVDVAASRLADPGFPAKRRLQLSLGDEGGDMRAGLERLAAALESGAPAGLDWHYEPLPEESHGTVFHAAAWAALRRLFATEEAR
jgi:predicted alpha/beta superfamily hydrolase